MLGRFSASVPVVALLLSMGWLVMRGCTCGVLAMIIVRAVGSILLMGISTGVVRDGVAMVGITLTSRCMTFARMIGLRMTGLRMTGLAMIILAVLGPGLIGCHRHRIPAGVRQGEPSGCPPDNTQEHCGCCKQPDLCQRHSACSCCSISHLVSRLPDYFRLARAMVMVRIASSARCNW